MDSFYLNTLGESISTMSANTPSLYITWGKAFDEIYCHHAILRFPYNSNSLFTPDLSKVSVNVRFNMIEKGVVKSSSDKLITRFLPCSIKDGFCEIPLNATETIDSLCENGWTTLKGGKRGAPKSYPLEISVSLENEEPIVLSFAHESGKFPFTFSEHLFNDLQESEKIETIIYF